MILGSSDGGSVSLSSIASSGQVFTWDADGASYLVSFGGSLARMRQASDCSVSVEPVLGDASPEDWARYLALGDDYASILPRLRLSGASLMANRGLRVLHQDWYDALVCFVISQNSNIPRIKGCVDRLRAAAGGVIPRPSRLADLMSDDAFADSLRLGYRVPYLRDVASRCASGWVPASVGGAGVALDEQIGELRRIRGVGPKVAACVCLFGLGYMGCVPRDVWIRRAEAAGVAWDPDYGGIQQQYVYADLVSGRMTVG